MKWRDVWHYLAVYAGYSIITVLRAIFLGGEPASGAEITAFAMGIVILMAMRESKEPRP